MLLSTKNAEASTMLMALVIAMFSATMAESMCSHYDGQRSSCQQQEGVCYWGRRQNKCLPIPTQQECAEKTKRLQCRKFGCVWNDDDGTCLSALPFIAHDAIPQPQTAIVNEERSLREDLVQTRPLFLDEEDRRPPQDIVENGDENGLARPPIIDEDEDQSIPEIEKLIETRPLFIDDEIERLPDELPQPIIANEDEEREYDDEEEESLDLFEDEDEEVDEDEDENAPRPIIINEDIDEKEKEPIITHFDSEGPLIINEDVDEEEQRPVDKVERGDNGVPESEKDFWNKLKGMKIKQAKQEIREEFGDKYMVVVCRRRRGHAECWKRNRDYSRVKIFPRKRTQVRKIEIG